jgi:pyruvate kinase
MRTHSFNKSKIIATLGPATSSVDRIRALIRAGADCFRINFSHGDGPALEPLIQSVREAERLEHAAVPILADVQGPKLRVGKMPTGGVTLLEGEPFVLTQREVTGSDQEAHSPYEFLAQDIQPGARVLLADGTIELVAERVEGPDVHCRVVTGGRLYSNKGLNLPGSRLSVDALTEKDKRDLAYITGADIDIVAISFVRTARDVLSARALLGGKKVTLIAKLERPEALDNVEEILETADGLMVARGDLGVEMPFEKVPTAQRLILAAATKKAKWAVVATQMLGSMVLNRRPSRAEVTDVATAVLDGADAVMLSEETATGKHPIEAVEAMVRIAREAEAHLASEAVRASPDLSSFAAGAAGAAVGAARTLGAKAIVALAGSGLTALLVSKWRPNVPTVALSTNTSTLRRINGLWGTVAVRIDDVLDMEKQLELADRFLLDEGWARPGDTVVVVASLPLGERKETNAIRFHRVRAAETGGGSMAPTTS